jgi:hypothetical protein
MLEKNIRSSARNSDVEEDDEVFHKPGQYGNANYLQVPVNRQMAKQMETFRVIDALPELSDEPEEPEERCGILCFKPDFLQKLRNMKIFLLVFIITGMAQGQSKRQNFFQINQSINQSIDQPRDQK